MEPITLAGSFATVVGLLIAYKGEQKTRNKQNYEDFQSWLAEKRHDHILDELENTKELAGGISTLLSANHDDIMGHLDRIEQQISFIGANTPLLESVAYAIHKDAGLSKQARAIAVQLVYADADYCQEHKVFTGDPDEFLFIGGKRRGEGKLVIKEPRFIDEDIEKLRELGLIRVSFTPKGSRKIMPTRLATELYHDNC